jgi:hypothetical protein
MNKWVRYLLIIGLLVFLVQQPAQAADFVTLGITLIQRLIGAIAAFVSEIAASLSG